MPREYRYTAAGISEPIDESAWQSPAHQISIEVDTHRGVRRRSVAGIRSASYLNAVVNKPLTDTKIDQYSRDGTYEARRQFMAEKARQQDVRNMLPRLVYDCEKRDFVEVYS